MDIIKTSIGLTKTIKNVARLREILSVFAKHGFDEFIISTKLDSLIPNFVIPRSRFKKEEDESEYDFWKSLGYRLRKSFEELGPSFIKVGQLLSSREDIFHPTLIQELKQLQNHAKEIKFQDAVSEIEKSLGKPYSHVYKSIDPLPIGVASIGVVYKAQLLDGKDVVLKVRRPNAKKSIVNDFEIISFIVNRLEKNSKELRHLGLSRAINDFFKSIQLELNFIFEANNNKKIGESIANIDTNSIFVIPNVYRKLSSERMLVMDYLNGKAFNEITDLSKYPELEEKLIEGVKLFLHNMLSDGFFHADLHGGNFIYLENGQIGLLDFGLVGVLSHKNRSNLIAILYALLSNNYENLVIEFLDVAEYDNIPNYDALVSDIRDALTPFVGLSAKEIDATQLTYCLISTLSKHEIYLPREWFVIFRAIMTLDGVGKSLGINLDIFAVIESEIKELMGDMFSKEAILEDSLWMARDMLGSLRILPRHISWMLKEFAKRKYTFEHNVVGLNQEVQKVSKGLFFLGMLILASTFFISGAILSDGVEVRSFQDVPPLTFVCWLLSMLTMLRASFFLKN